MTLKEFYPFYLSQHSHPVCRFLHWFGLNIAVLCIGYAFMTQTLAPLLWALVAGYGFAFTGHLFEGNKPASFTHSWWLSFKSDWKMWWEIWTGKRGFSG